MGLDVVGEIGMGSDLSLDLRHFASKAVRQTSKDNSPASDVDGYIRQLQEERGKIEVFRRELPLCARLLADVIDVMKEETDKKKGDGEEEEEDGAAAGDKSKWMSTARLWTGGGGGAAESVKQVKQGRRNSPDAKPFGGAFTPFEAVAGSGAPPCLRKDDKTADVGTPVDLSLLPPPPVIKTAPAAADESRRQVVGFAQAATRAAAAMAPSCPALRLQPQQTTTTQQQARKSRRCWSPELHRQFVAALNQLGGPQVATPKQIRELMKVDGLTNDEVKSHLQKHRLHNRRSPGSGMVSHHHQPIVPVGGLWISHHQEQQQSSGSCQQSSGSPQGPLHFSSTSGGGGVVAGSSAATWEEEEEDGGSRSESYGWK